MNELAIPEDAPHDGVDSWVEVLVPVGQLAKSIAQTDFVPESFRGNAAAVAAAVLYGREVNLPPMASLTSIHVVKGKPSLSAEAMRGLVLAAGHDITIRETNSTRCILAGRRRGSDEWTEIGFTMDDAKRAGLQGGNWSKYPTEMLMARATTRLCRAIFPDAIAGLRSIEEMEDIDRAPTETKATKPRRRAIQRTKQPEQQPVESAATPEPAPELPELPEPPGPDGDAVTKAQLTKIAIITDELGQGERDDRLRLISAIAGRPIESGKELTKSEASKTIEALALIKESDNPQAALAVIEEQQ